MPVRDIKKMKRQPSSRTEKDLALEQILENYLGEFIAGNLAAKTIAAGLRVVGVGLRPLVDHLIFRTLEAQKRASEFLPLGYVWDRKAGILEYGAARARVCTKRGFPALIFEEPAAGVKGRKSAVADWVKAFGERSAFSVAVRVDELEQAVFYLEKQAVPFTGVFAGEKSGILRQIFSSPEIREGRAYTVLELVERRSGFEGFFPAHLGALSGSVDRLMPGSNRF